jgi:Fur family transcriptional regulator, peroxide stress response regulator
MNPPEREVRRRISHFREGIREAGVKLTHQRLEIFTEVARSGDHPDAAMIYKAVRERIPSISLDTVYRTLWLLFDLGLITTLGLNRGGARFDANLDPHHHFVCTSCGTAEDFYSEQLDRLEIPEEAKALGRAKGTHVEVRGLCLRCSRRAPKGRA